jgi:hypothetical protein
MLILKILKFSLLIKFDILDNNSQLRNLYEAIKR